MAVSKWWHRHMASRVVTMTSRPVLESHHRIATLGSCFAAEIRRALQDRVRGSHRPKAKPPAFVWTLRRIGDDEIAAAYGEGSVVEAVGARGTVPCGDTKAWHKGVAPTARPRPMLQVLFADTLLLSKDNGRSRIRKDRGPDFLAFVDEHPEVFANFIRE